MIVLINGPLGVGKTAVSWALLDLFGRGAMIDMDYVISVKPYDFYDEADLAYAWDLMEQLARHHHAHGYEDLVIGWVFEDPDTLATLRRRLMAISYPVLTYWLTAEADEIARRVRARNTPDVEWELKRFQEHLAMFERERDRGDLGYIVDTTHLSPREAAQAIYDDFTRPVELVPYDPAWAAAFERERTLITEVLRDAVVAIHHVGSTAIPGMLAKPVIDIMVTLPRLDEATDCIGPLREIGYYFRDHPDNDDRRFFRKGTPRTHHVHLVEHGSRGAAATLAFRDALRADAALRDRYAELKRALQQAHPRDTIAFSQDKGAFVREVLERAR